MFRFEADMFLSGTHMFPFGNHMFASESYVGFSGTSYVSFSEPRRLKLHTFVPKHSPFAFGTAENGRGIGGNSRPLVVRRRDPSTPATEDPASSSRRRSSCELEAETHDGRQVELPHPGAIKNACGAAAAGPPQAGAIKNGYGDSFATSPSGDSARRCDPARRRSLSCQCRRS